MSTITDLPASTRTLFRSPPKVRGQLPTQGSLGSATASITFSCDYPDLQQFLNVVCGLPVTIGKVGSAVITRIVPLIHPQYPAMLAQSFDVDAKGYDATKDKGSLLIPYAKAVITVNFGTVTYQLQGNVEDGAFMKLSTKHSGESYTVPNTAYILSGIPLQQDVGITVGTTALELTLYQSPSASDAFLGPFQGYINSAEFLGYEAGCVRFDGASQDYEQSFNGVQTYTKTLTFMYRRIPWNYTLNHIGEWDTPVKSTDGTYMYPDSVDFYTLLQ